MLSYTLRSHSITEGGQDMEQELKQNQLAHWHTRPAFSLPRGQGTTHSGLSPLTSDIKICEQIYWPILSLAHLHESDYIFRVSLKVP